MGLKGDMLNSGSGESVLYNQVCLLKPLLNITMANLVVVGDAFFLKPYLMQAFAKLPVCARFYAHELICHRDMLRFKAGAPCPNHYLQNPETCRACAYEHLKPRLQHGLQDAWTREYAITKAYEPAYHGLLREALSGIEVAIVSNPDMATPLAEYCRETTVISGGIDLDQFVVVPPPGAAKKVIYLPGRAEDPAKGLQVMLDAGEQLRQHRDDFVLRAVMPWRSGLPEWVEALPWSSFEESLQHYQQADICVIPSLWEEPFGLVAVEAMAAARPVCASRSGGLKTIVQHEENGLLFTPGDATGLATCIARLLDDTEFSQRLAAAGRSRVETTYTWRNVVESQYSSLFNRLCRTSR